MTTVTLGASPAVSPRRESFRAADPAWKRVYQLGGVAALIAVVFFFADIIIFVGGGAQPASAGEWFSLLQRDRVGGLLHLLFPDLLGLILLAPLVLSLYAVLRHTHAAYAALSAMLAFLGVALVLAANSNYALLYLGERYAAASSEAQRALFLAAAESALAQSTWGTGPLVAGALLEGALTLFSCLMLCDTVFGKRIGWLGIVAHGLDLAHAVAFLLLVPLVNTGTAVAVGTPLLAIGGTFQFFWYTLVGVRLLQLARQTSNANT
jgi:hypothetical protein